MADQLGHLHKTGQQKAQQNHQTSMFSKHRIHIWQKKAKGHEADDIPDKVCQHRCHAQLLTVDPESGNLPKKLQIVSIFTCSGSSTIVFRKEQQIHQQHNIDPEKDLTAQNDVPLRSACHHRPPGSDPVSAAQQLAG